MNFELLPNDPEPAASSITDFQRMLVQWDCLPRELREERQKTLNGFSRANGFTPERAMREMEKDSYKLARRAYSVEVGELNHKVRAILDVAYEQALTGNKDARRDWLGHYAAEVKPVTASSPPTPDPVPEVPSSPEDMSDEQLANQLAEWSSE